MALAAGVLERPRLSSWILSAFPNLEVALAALGEGHTRSVAVSGAIHEHDLAATRYHLQMEQGKLEEARVSLAEAYEARDHFEELAAPFYEQLFYLFGDEEYIISANDARAGILMDKIYLERRFELS
mmetsp:Transcript_18109/g.36867  ORF Transcript_18109/g.36867 Transcript_18109/m.36867 type:complete len:127 (+) Transcript_18109:280-660(+)